MVYQKNERAISTKMNAINDTEQKQAHTIGGHWALKGGTWLLPQCAS